MEGTTHGKTLRKSGHVGENTPKNSFFSRGRLTESKVKDTKNKNEEQIHQNPQNNGETTNRIIYSSMIIITSHMFEFEWPCEGSSCLSLFGRVE